MNSENINTKAIRIMKELIKPKTTDNFGINKTEKVISISQPLKNTSKMSIHAVRLYKLGGVQWVFDDKNMDIYEEAFINGADDLIEEYIKSSFGKVKAKQDYTLVFSRNKIERGVRIEAMNYTEDNQIFEEHGRHWKVKSLNANDSWEQGRQLWLCPTFYQYFPNDTTEIYFLIKENQDG